MPYKNPEDRKAQWKRWRQNTPQRAREIQLDYQSRNASVVNERSRRGKAVNPQREFAESKIRFAVRRGWLQRPEGTVFHHPDYSRPYYGCWVTQLTHMQIHAGLIECPPCRDYEQKVRVQAEAAKKEGQRRGGKNACRTRWQGI